jgi:phosphoglycerol transferase
MGCQIEGERLGLGTNLFSNTKTLGEELGSNGFNDELNMPSSYYTSEFYFEK